MAGNSAWKRFFASAAAGYDDQPFTDATDAEVAFVCDVLTLEPGEHVVDIGCGTGRHAVPLAARGLRVTGVDVSPAMLAQARGRAEAAGVRLELLEADARELPPIGPFDAAICLCEGAFCLVADDAEPIDHDRSVLASIHRVLRPGGRLLLTGLSAARMLASWRRGEVEGDVDLLTLTEASEHTIDDGATVRLREHYHLPDTLRLLAEVVGFAVEAVWAGGAGDWRREPPTVEDYELMLLARRAPESHDG
jgi:SAM-dependent methyltransferase